MRLLNTDGEYGCIASWVRPEISKGGRKIVLHNEFTGEEMDIDRGDAHTLFKLTGNEEPVTDMNSAKLFNVLLEEKYVEKTEVRIHVKRTLADMFYQDIEDTSEMFDSDLSIDELAALSESVIDRAFQTYDEEWRTYSKSATPLFWTIILFVLGAVIIPFGTVMEIRSLLNGVIYNYFVIADGWGSLYIVLSGAAAFFLDGFLRDQCHGFVAKRFGARVIYKGFFNGKWFHGDWYLIDDSVVRGKHCDIQRVFIRLAGSYCDFLVVIIFATILPFVGNGILYAVVSGMLFGVIIRCMFHLCPIIVFDDWKHIAEAMLHSEDILTDVLYFFQLCSSQSTRQELFKQKGVQGIGIILISVLLCIGAIVGYVAFIGMIVLLAGCLWG